MDKNLHSTPSSIKGLSIPFSGKDILKKGKNTGFGKMVNRVRSEIDSTLSVQETRELVHGHDIDYLKKLEKKYSSFGDINNLGICSEINILEEQIIVAGLKIDRFNFSPSPNNQIGIFRYPKSRYTFFDYNVLSQFCDESRRLLTENDIEFLINNMPGNKIDEKIYNFIRILNFYLGGYYSSTVDDFFGNSIYGKYWLQLNNGSTKGEYFYLSKNRVSINSKLLLTDGCLVRFIIK